MEALSKLTILRHASTAQKVVLNSEHEPTFTAMLNDYRGLRKPEGIEEIDLLREIVVHKWRQERHWHLETAILDLAAAESETEIKKHFNVISDMAKLAHALVQQHGHTKALELNSRLEGRMRRLHQSARRDLEHLQAARNPTAIKEVRQAKPAKPSKPAEEPPNQPITFQSLLTPEERAKIEKNRSRPKFDLNLPEFFPGEEPKTPKAA